MLVFQKKRGSELDKNSPIHNRSHAHKIEFRPLEEVDKADILELMNHPLVRRQLPLAKGYFDDEAYNSFISNKRQLWLKHGYGPSAFFIDNKFAGWGGLQWEEGDADLALVLHPNYWGMGKQLFYKIIEHAFHEMGLSDITILLPPTRKYEKVLSRFHFKPDGQLTIDGQLFLRFRLFSSTHKNGSKNSKGKSIWP